MKNQHRVLSLLLAIAMIVSMFTITAAAADAAVSTDADSPVQIRKWAEQNPDGSYALTMEAYVTGSVQQNNPDPLDIVLVLDQSGSMAYDFNGNSTNTNSNRRQYAMKNAVKNFIEAVGEKYQTATSNHRIALVTFGSTASTLKDWTQADAEGLITLKSSIDNLPNQPSGATNIGAGMEQAEYLINSSNDGRQKIVIVFTDGVPTTSTEFSISVANTAITSSKNLKTTGADVYTVGIFTGANPAQLHGEKIDYAILPDEPCDGSVGSRWGVSHLESFFGDIREVDIAAGNRFLNYLSSNFESASEIGLETFSEALASGYKITKNFIQSSSNYYLIASDAGSLDNVFGEIAETIVPGITAGAETILQDTLTDEFVFSGVSSESGMVTDVTVLESSAFGSGSQPTWSEAVASSAEFNVNGKTISISGFDYASNAVVKSSGSWTGKKLIVSFGIAPNPNAQWQSGTHFYDTNNTSRNKAGLYDQTGSPLDVLNESPQLPVTTYTVSYRFTSTENPDDVSAPTSVDYIPGASVSVHSGWEEIDVYDSTNSYVIGTWFFSGWDTDDASVSSGSFNMPGNDVEFTGEWTYSEAETYTVSYRFTSTENPDGVSAPTAVDYIPGASVSVHSGWENIDVYDSTNSHVIGTWSFSGWDTDDASVSSGSFNMPGNDVEFTGEWTYSEAETYNVTYHLVGTVKPTDDWSVPTDANSYYAGQTVDVIAQSNVNETYGYYTFDGWYTDEAMTLAAGAGVAMPAGGLHLYGSWRWVQTVILTSSFSFSKVDRFGLALNGARFGLYTDSACKNLISTAVSMSKGNGIQTEKGIVTFDNVPVQDATYYLKEISAPRGYVTSDDVYEVRVRASDDASIDVRVRLVGSSSWTTVSRLRIVNLQAEKETGSVRISKEISGKIYSVGNKQFVFNIYDAWGELAGATQMTAGQTKVVDLEPGVYTITEANPELSGYSVKTYINGAKLPDVSVVVRVEEGKVVDVDYENVYELDIDLNIEDHYAYIVGYPDGTVGPNNAITRAEVATIFFRMLTDDAREHYYSITNSFTDVDSSDWFNVAVSTLSNAGVLTGYEDGSFQPNRSITRAELVTIAMSFFDFVEENSEELFTDVAGHWADASINFAAQLGIVTGYGDGTFAPDKTITRAETITIINRVLYRAPHDNHLLPQMTTWSDNKPGTWYYAQVQEATNSHTYSWTIVNGARYEDWEGLLPVRDWAAIERAWTQAYLAGDYGEVMDD